LTLTNRIKVKVVIGADGGTRTHTTFYGPGILSPVRLPFRHIGLRAATFTKVDCPRKQAARARGLVESWTGYDLFAWIHPGKVLAGLSGSCSSGRVPGASSLEARLQRETLVAQGQTADVFSWGHESVLKLYFPSLPVETTQREYTIARAIHAAGHTVPAVRDVIQIRGRHGIIFERVPGRSLVQQVERQPWKLFVAARQLAEWHVRLHDCAAPVELPAQRDQIAQWIEAAAGCSDDDKETARRHLAQLPPGDRLCHGDFHPANVLLSARGPVIIDWSTGTRGHPLADVARTSVLFESASLPADTAVHLRLLMKFARRLLHATYLKRYFELRPDSTDALEYWRVPQRMAGLAWRAERKRDCVVTSHLPL
jgi:uncharacterized protein (TIGR02172 family)